MRIIILLLCLFFLPCQASLVDRDDVQNFMSRMVEQHGFSKDDLHFLFRKVHISDRVLNAVSRPAEKLPWFRYRSIFLQPDRIKLGVKFLKENSQVLARAEKIYGVPPEIIVAIIGVETRYGRNKGKYKVINSLSTLAFAYPERSNFFTKELEQFLLLTRDQGINPVKLTGSYAGAMGIPQFISSSYRNYAVDFDGDGLIDIWENYTDAIGSIGNYFFRHGWQVDKEIVIKTRVSGDRYIAALTEGLKPDLLFSDLKKLDIKPEHQLAPDTKAKLLHFENNNGKEYWLGLNNFYVITRYNHSSLYAMAVYQLAMEIRNKYQLTVTTEKQ